MPFSTTQINLSWTAPSGAISGYNVYRGTTPGGENYASPINGGALVAATSYNDASAVAGVAYYYTVEAVNASGSSAASSEAFASQTLYWTGGDGSWSVGGGGWADANNNPVNWSNGDIAVFDGASGGAVTIFESVAPLEIEFETGGYALGGGEIALPAGGGVVRVDAAAATIAATIASGALAKGGSSALILSGASGYAGETVVVAGEVVVNGSLSSSGAVVVASGATLAGSGSVGAVYVDSGGTLAPGAGGSGALTAVAVQLFAGCALTWFSGTGNSSTDGLVVVGGALELAAGVVVNVTPAANWGNGMYPLLSLPGMNYPNPVTLDAGWTVAGAGLGGHYYSLVATGDNIDLDVQAVNGVWTASGDGTYAWGSGGNWLGGVAPNGVGDTAVLGTAVGSGTATIALGAAADVERPEFQPWGRRRLRPQRQRVQRAATGQRRRFGERFDLQRGRFDQRLRSCWRATRMWPRRAERA